MFLLFSLLPLVFGLLLLCFGAKWLIQSSASLAALWGLSPFFTGLVIVGYGSSAPELLVTLDALFLGHADVSSGNIIGSNIFNSSCIVGLGLMIRPTACEKNIRWIDAPFMGLCSLALVIAGLQGLTSRWLGACFLLLLGLYTAYSYFYGKNRPQNPSENKIDTWSARRSCLFLPISLASLLYGSHLFLISCLFLAQQLGLSDTIIGLTLTSIGTSLPELAATVTAAYRRQQMLLIGGIVGSNIYNVLGILGSISLVQPLSFVEISYVDYGFLLFLHGAFILQLLYKPYLGRRQGALFFLSYGAYLSYLLLQKIH